MMNQNPSFRIIAFGDIHMQLGRLSDIPQLADAHLVVLTGDLTNFGGQKDAQNINTKIQKYNSKILAVSGNLDQPDVETYLLAQNMSLHGQGRVIKNLGIIGLGGSNLTPFHTPNEFGEDEIDRLLHQAYEQVQQADRLLLISHPPPFNTKADQLANGSHVGSVAVRRFIEQVQPNFCLTGHIHEARSEDSIGVCKILNPGMFQTGGWIEIMINKHESTGLLRPWT